MKTIKINKFSVDRSLGYLIQNSTNDSTQEILSYFYSVAIFTLDSLSKKSKARFHDKSIVLFYKETPILYRLRIIGSGVAFRQGNPNYQPTVEINVGYPNEKESFDVKDIVNSIVETGLELLDTHQVPKFEVPQLKTPKCLRKVRIAQDADRRKTASST